MSKRIVAVVLVASACTGSPSGNPTQRVGVGAAQRLLVDPVVSVGRAGGQGMGLAAPGDVTGDGIPDLLVGQPGSAEGSIMLFAGRASGFSSTPVQSWTGTDGQGLGQVLLAPGDVNGDGHVDFLAVDARPSWEQDAHLFLGTGDPLAPFGAAPDQRLEDLIPDLVVGELLKSAGDLNGDGYADVVACDRAGGRLKILWGGAPLSVEEVPLSAFGVEGRCSVGAGVDLTGDGHPDIALGNPAASKVGLYAGGPAGIAREAVAWTDPVTSTDRYSSFPTQLELVADMNGDGLPEVAATTKYLSEDWYDTGFTSIFSGGPTLGPRVFSGSMAQTLSDVGDLDGDGLHELVISHEYLSTEYAQYVEVVWGEEGLSDAAAVDRLAVGGRDLRGAAVAPLGDFDGDGLDDFVVGDSSTGEVVLVHGSALTPEEGGDTGGVPAEPEDTGGADPVGTDSGTPGDVATGDPERPEAAVGGAGEPEDDADTVDPDKASGCQTASAPAAFGLCGLALLGAAARRQRGLSPAP